ncbi:MAG: methyltransferase domain-containing protein [Candidatus Edwardsbacteria bacterium]
MLEIDDWVICPECKGSLRNEGRHYLCLKCREQFPIEAGIPILLPKKLSDFKKAEALFYSRQAESPSLSVLQRNFYRSSLYDRHLDLLPYQFLSQNFLVLSLGGGTGLHGLNLVKHGCRVVESDLAFKAVSKAKERYDCASLAERAAFATIDAERIPFRSELFDVVHICAALHQLTEPLTALKEIFRCLKSKGVLLLTGEPNAWFYQSLRPLASLLHLRAGQREEQSVGDERNRGISKNRMKYLLKETGLALKVLQPKYYLTGFLYHSTEAIYRLLPSRQKERLTIRQWEVDILTAIDRILQGIPVVKDYPFLWLVVAEKP